MKRLKRRAKSVNEQAYGGAALAYIGDAVLEVLVREMLLASGTTDTGKLSAEAQTLVCAGAQSTRLEKILPYLTDEENAAVHLGRNHKTQVKPKHSSVVEYRRATGFEAVFGRLYLGGNTERLRELFRIAYDK
jgi:ribonuclease-3 family protein